MSHGHRHRARAGVPNGRSPRTRVAFFAVITLDRALIDEPIADSDGRSQRGRWPIRASHVAAAVHMTQPPSCGNTSSGANGRERILVCRVVDRFIDMRCRDSRLNHYARGDGQSTRLANLSGRPRRVRPGSVAPSQAAPAGSSTPCGPSPLRSAECNPLDVCFSRRFRHSVTHRFVRSIIHPAVAGRTVTGRRSAI